MQDFTVSVAPMMDWTDRHCRYFLRGFSPRVLLYTEMITAAAIEHGDVARLLRHSPEEHPLALQLGGSDPRALALATRAGVEAGYDEINLNCGCPSDRVREGSFGACLMLEPELVAGCVSAMRNAAGAVPVTVKMRIGVIGGGAREARADFTEADYDRLRHFTATVAAAGCGRFIVHARKAVLGGLSPRENREVPPLRFDVVQRLDGDFPQLSFVLNGGLRTADAATGALTWADGVMLGREAYHRPYVLSELHQRVFDHQWQPPAPEALLERMARYADVQLERGDSLPSITRHMLGLLSGRPGARRFRQRLSEGARSPGRGAELLQEAVDWCNA